MFGPQTNKRDTSCFGSAGSQMGTFKLLISKGASVDAKGHLLGDNEDVTIAILLLQHWHSPHWLEKLEVLVKMVPICIIGLKTATLFCIIYPSVRA